MFMFIRYPVLVGIFFAFSVESQTNLPGMCWLQPRTGPCRAHVIKYYYCATTDTCETFVYGGCFRNDNFFDSVDECEQQCTVEQRDRPSACYLPRDEGTPGCFLRRRNMESGTRWYFSEVDDRCMTMEYTGCNGNQNNFASEEACERTCAGNSTTVGPTTTEVTETTEGTTTPESTETTEGTTTPEATGTTEGTTTPEATETTEGTTTPEATGTPEGTTTPEATETPEGTTTPEATETTEGTTTPEATETTEVTQTNPTTPEETETTAATTPTETTEATTDPSATVAPETTDAPTTSATSQ